MVLGLFLGPIMDDLGWFLGPIMDSLGWFLGPILDVLGWRVDPIKMLWGCFLDQEWLFSDDALGQLFMLIVRLLLTYLVEFPRSWSKQSYVSKDRGKVRKSKSEVKSYSKFQICFGLLTDKLSAAQSLWNAPFTKLK